jgi:iron(III) transport system ATP-binding protein
MSAAGISAEGVAKRFRHRVKGEVYAVRDVTLEVKPGEFLTLLGPSGCGKTTMLRIIGGFERPDAGRVLIGGQDVTWQLANQRNLGFVFQNYALFPHLSVFENVAYGLRVRRQSEAQIERAVGDVLALVGLSAYERQFPSQLSGGEQQRVALARAIVIQPRVLLFDEPLSNLDARLRVQMRVEIRALQRRLSITTVYVTHDQEEAMAVSDHIAVMEAGRVVQQGSAEDLYYRPRSEFLANFIGRANLVRGRVVSVDAAGAEIEALGLRMRTPTPGLTPGAAVKPVLRPETLELVDAPGTASIVSRMFLGDSVEYVVRCAGETLHISASSASANPALGEGRSVALRMAAREVAVLPERSP